MMKMPVLVPDTARTSPLRVLSVLRILLGAGVVTGVLFLALYAMRRADQRDIEQRAHERKAWLRTKDYAAHQAFLAAAKHTREERRAAESERLVGEPLPRRTTNRMKSSTPRRASLTRCHPRNARGT